MIRGILYGLFAGCFVSGAMGVVEASWLIFKRDFEFGVLHESLLLAESLVLYLIAGAVIGGLIGLVIWVVNLVLARKVAHGVVLTEASAAVVSVLAAVCVATVVFVKFVPDDVVVRLGFRIAGAVSVVVAVVGGFFVIRWFFARIASSVFASWANTKTMAGSFLVLLILPMLVLIAVQHVSTSRTKHSVGCRNTRPGETLQMLD